MRPFVLLPPSLNRELLLLWRDLGENFEGYAADSSIVRLLVFQVVIYFRAGKASPT